ncbi:tRNA-guanine transglycosylase [Agrocybe pediades]|nr:tRNA-guanine transglycosylase [Agrocybe pediades]
MSHPGASSFSFTLSSSPLSSSSRFGARVGTILYRRPNFNEDIEVHTPGLLTATSRGVVPHLSRDHHRSTAAVRWVNVPFETFLEHNPPVPTLQPGANPLHKFLGYTPGKHIVSMSARDPYDGREMPTNGQNHVAVYGLRGVRKLSPTDWWKYVNTCQPDVVFALSDTPFTSPPYSQKRLTKSIERSAAWLATLLRPTPPSNPSIPPIFLHLSGLTNAAARRAFSSSLLEPLYGPELEAIAPLQTLDEGVVGYSIDLVPLRQSLEALERKNPHPGSETDLNPVLPTHTKQIVDLVKASLEKLPENKPRLVNSTESPHEILRYIRDVGVDLFDAHWAQRAADIGVALDFEFPVRQAGKRDIGHNLYDSQYTFDFGSFADAFRGAAAESNEKPVCPCLACSPLSPPSRLYHGYDTPDVSGEAPRTPLVPQPHFTRAYVHHLLHTHEMSAHTLLTMHNLTVLDLFFAGIRDVLSSSPATFDEEVEKFVQTYRDVVSSDGIPGVFEAAKESWKQVEMARGKGRLAREKEKQELDGTLGTTVDVQIEGGPLE